MLSGLIGSILAPTLANLVCPMDGGDNGDPLAGAINLLSGITNTRTGSRMSRYGNTVVAADTPDITSAGGVDFLTVLTGVTNLSWTDIEDFNNPDGLTFPTSTRMREDSSNGRHRTESSALTSAQHYVTCRARHITGSRYLLLYKFGELAAERLEIDLVTATVTDSTGLAAGDFDVQLRSDGWVYISAFFDNGAVRGFVVAMSEGGASDNYQGDGVSEIEVQNFMDSATIYPNLAPPPGSAAGASYGIDAAAITPAWPAQGSVVAVAIPFGWSGTDQTLSGAPRVYDNAFPVVFSDDTGAFGPRDGALTMQSAPSISNFIKSGAILSDGVAETSCLTWDGAQLQFAGGNESLQSAASAVVPSGVLYLADNSSGTRTFQGTIAAYLFDRVLTDEEYSAVRTYLLNAAASLS